MNVLELKKDFEINNDEYKKEINKLKRLTGFYEEHPERICEIMPQFEKFNDETVCIRKDLSQFERMTKEELYNCWRNQDKITLDEYQYLLKKMEV